MKNFITGLGILAAIIPVIIQVLENQKSEEGKK
jgi:hypothetical protein